MKKLFAILGLFVLCSVSSRAASRITATITITNVPNAADTLTVNADSRTWVTNVANSANQVLIGADLGSCATNLYLHIGQSRFAGNVVLGFTGTNAVTLAAQAGGAMSVSEGGTWASITLSTQTVTTAYFVRVPASAEPTQSQATNIISQLASDIGTYSTSSIPATATALANYVSVTSTQTVTGPKTFANGGNLWNGGGVTNCYIGNVSMFYALTNSGVMYWASGGSQPSYAIAPDINGKPSIWSVNIDPITFQRVLGTFVPYSPGDNNLLTFNVASNKFGILTNANSWTGVNTFSSLTGNATSLVSSNSSTAGTFTHGSDVSFSRVNNTSLASGNNAGVNFGATAVYVKIKSGPGAPFTINGIAGGRDGRVLILDNATSQSMTIANDSGVEPTPANRIYTRTGTDVTTGTQGVATLIYDAESTHWILETFNAGGAGVTSVALSVPSPFTVSGSPVTGAGTITISNPNGTTGSGAFMLANQPTLTGTTNQIIFGATNTAPATPGTVAAWISVQVSGDTNAYRLPLYK